MSELQELSQFLDLDTRIDVKTFAVQTVLGLTGTPEGISSMSEAPDLIAKLVHLLADPQIAIAKDASLALINLSADPSMAKTMLKSNNISVVKGLFEIIENQDSHLADPASMILSNLTRDVVSCKLVLQQIDKEKIGVEKIVFIMCQEGYNKHGADLRYLGPVLSNLSQLAEGRQQILDHDKCVIQRLLPFTEYKASVVKRGGIVGTLKNCCFVHQEHPWLMGDEVDIVPRLLLPLAGPTPESFDDEDIDKLPLELQYLDEDKEIEEDDDIRKILLEALNQLCCTKQGRLLMREKNVYVILRELHKVEKNKQVLLACENIVDILIKTEEEINLENYTDVDVPEDLVKTLEDIDKDYLNN